jgi:TusA-related sulfurtransferase
MTNDAVVIDSLGKPCPVPVIELAEAVAQVAVGDLVVLLADDPAARTDVAVWCRMKRHELVDVAEGARGLRFTVRRC